MMARANRTPTFLWQGTLILLPVVVMTALGLAAILRDKAAVEHEAEQRARELLQPLAPELAQRFALQLARFDLDANHWAARQRARIESPSPARPRIQTSHRLRPFQFNPETWFEEWSPHWQATFPNLRPEDALPNRLLFTAEGSLPWPLGYDVPPQPPRWLVELTLEQRAAWETLRQTRTSGANPLDRESAARRFLETAPSDEARANAEFLDLANPATGTPPLETATALLGFARTYPDAVGESGLPLSTLAIARSLNLSPPARHLWPAIRDQVAHAPSLLTPTLLEQARPLAATSAALSSALADLVTPLAATDANVPTGLAALTAQWAGEERLRDLAKALRDSGHGPSLNPTSCWLSARQDQWFCVMNPAHFVLDPYGQASPAASEPEVVDVRFYPKTALLAGFAEAARGLKVALPPYVGLTAELEGETLSRDARQSPGRTLAEISEGLRIPASLPSDPEPEGSIRAKPYVGQSHPFPINQLDPVSFPEFDLDFLPSQPRLKICLGLADPALLFSQQRQRTLLYGGVIGVSFLAALAGLAAARRAFYRQLRLNELKSNFVSSVSHELRAPIASVRLMAESLERGKIPAGPKQQDYFRFIGQECRRLSSLIENVLDFSRIEQGRKQYDFEPTDLVALVRQTVALMRTYAAEGRVEVALTIPESQLPILSTRPVLDGKAIQQALVNLIDNAIKHSPPGATVAVGLETRTGDPPTGSARLALWVEDHGEGIPAEEQARIFERFYRRGAELRRQTQGVGIGLSIVKHLVEAHGGTVLVKSAVGQGSRFTIDLPLAGPANPAIIS